MIKNIISDAMLNGDMANVTLTYIFKITQFKILNDDEKTTRDRKQ